MVDRLFEGQNFDASEHQQLARAEGSRKNHGNPGTENTLPSK